MKLSEWHISTSMKGYKNIFDNLGVPIFILDKEQTNLFHDKNEQTIIMNLIAAAPELLNVLIALVNAHDEEPSMLTAKEWQAAREAIAKAQQRIEI